MKGRTTKSRQQPNKFIYIGIATAVVLFVGAVAAVKYGHAKDPVASIHQNVERQVAQAKIQMPKPKVHEDKLEACYITFLKSKPKHDEGALVVHWDLNKKGEVSSTKLVQNDLKDEKFTQCVLENLKKAQFSKVTTAMTVAHRYNFKRRAPASL